MRVRGLRGSSNLLVKVGSVRTTERTIGLTTDIQCLGDRLQSVYSIKLAPTFMQVVFCPVCEFHMPVIFCNPARVSFVIIVHGIPVLHTPHDIKGMAKRVSTCSQPVPSVKIEDIPP